MYSRPVMDLFLSKAHNSPMIYHLLVCTCFHSLSLALSEKYWIEVMYFWQDGFCPHCAGITWINACQFPFPFPLQKASGCFLTTNPNSGHGLPIAIVEFTVHVQALEICPLSRLPLHKKACASGEEAGVLLSNTWSLSYLLRFPFSQPPPHKCMGPLQSEPEKNFHTSGTSAQNVSECCKCFKLSQLDNDGPIQVSYLVYHIQKYSGRSQA